MSKCTYKYQDGSTCNREALPDRSLCILHEDFGHKDPGQTNSAFQEEINKGTTHFEGFNLFATKISDREFKTSITFKDIYIMGTLQFVAVKCKGELRIENITSSELCITKSEIQLCKIDASTFDQAMEIFHSKITYLELKNITIEKGGKCRLDNSSLLDIVLQNSGLENLSIDSCETTSLTIKTCEFYGETEINYFSEIPIERKELRCISENNFFESLSFANHSCIGKVSFKETRFNHAHFENLNFEKSECRFEQCTFDGKCLILQCRFWDYLSFEGSTFTDLKSQEEAGRRAKIVLDRGGYHELADIHHLMEMRARRKQKKMNCLKLTWFCKIVNCLRINRFPEWLFMDFIAQYGTSFKWLLRAWGFLILVYSLAYRFIPNMIDKSELYIGSFWEALYFSIVTATTLGYGDLQPVGWGRLIAASEAMLGMLLWALLLVVIARKYMRS